jgi:hypothetical protein
MYVIREIMREEGVKEREIERNGDQVDWGGGKQKKTRI